MEWAILTASFRSDLCSHESKAFGKGSLGTVPNADTFTFFKGERQKRQQNRLTYSTN